MHPEIMAEGVYAERARGVEKEKQMEVSVNVTIKGAEYDTFITEMNKRAKEIGASTATFQDASDLKWSKSRTE